MDASEWSGFDPGEYLREYYADVGDENFAVMRFLVNAFQNVPADSVVLDFGGGPTLYSAIVASAKASEIHFCDYLESNLEEIRKWQTRDPTAFDWGVFTRTALQLEGKDCHAQSIVERENTVRERVTRIMRCDANLLHPLADISWQYDVLTTQFCAESATNQREQWRRYLHNIISLLKPTGKLVLGALKGADSYSVGKQTFPAVNIVEADLRQALIEEGLAEASIFIESVTADRPSRHYQGLMLATATKN